MASTIELPHISSAIKIKNETNARTESRSISFAYRGYIGDVDAGFSVSSGTLYDLLYDEYNSNTHFLSTTKSNEYKSSGALQNRRIIYVYPQNIGDITDFIDGNGYDVNNLFTKSTVKIVSLNGKTITYNVYISDIINTDNKVTVKFS